MGKIGNSTNAPDSTDMWNTPAQPISSGHKGGRRVKKGKKEAQLTAARSTSLQHKHVFRSGSQDARTGGDAPGPVSPAAASLKTRRRGNGPAMIKPPAHS